MFVGNGLDRYPDLVQGEGVALAPEMHPCAQWIAVVATDAMARGRPFPRHSRNLPITRPGRLCPSTSPSDYLRRTRSTCADLMRCPRPGGGAMTDVMADREFKVRVFRWTDIPTAVSIDAQAFPYDPWSAETF